LGRRSRKRAGRPPAQPQPVTRKRPRGEERDAAVRAELEPLAVGERPGAVTVAAVVSGALALGNLVAYVAGLKIGDDRPQFSAVVASQILLWVMAIGMWRARYWAVLGFEFLLGLLVVFLALLLVVASNVLAVVVVLAIGVPAGWLFWKLVRAMARIQMPERPG
jgi:hypothetical protein